jgi:hypothetical protein
MLAVADKENEMEEQDELARKTADHPPIGTAKKAPRSYAKVQAQTTEFPVVARVPVPLSVVKNPPKKVTAKEARAIKMAEEKSDAYRIDGKSIANESARVLTYHRR